MAFIISYFRVKPKVANEIHHLVFSSFRITSYNVCYTKLLRQGLIISIKLLIFFEDCTYWTIIENYSTTADRRKVLEQAKSFKVLAKLTGFLIVLVGSNLFSLSAMAFWAIPLYVISGWGLWQSLKNSNIDDQLEEYHDKVTRPSRKFTPDSFWAFGISNPYVLKLGLLTVCMACVWGIVEFFFMVDLRVSLFTPQKGLIALSLLLIVSYAIVATITPFFSSRKLQDIGIKKLLTIPPLILLCIVVLTYLVLRFSPPQLPVMLTLVAIVFIMTRNIILTTVTPSLLRPIQKKHRGFTFGILRGFFGSLGLILSGFFLWIVNADVSSREGTMIVWLSISFLLAWWLCAKIVSRDYRVIIRRAFLLRDIESYEIATHDQEVNRLLVNKLISHRPEDVLYALEANTMINPKKNETVLLHMLRHPEEVVRYFSITFNEEIKTPKIEEAIKKLALKDPDPRVRKKAIISTCKSDPTFIKEVIDWIDDDNKEIRKGALYGLLSSESEEQRTIALNYIKNTLKSENPKQKIFALKILAKVSPKESEPYIFDAIIDGDDLLIKEGIKIAGIVKSPTHIPLLINLLKENKFNRNNFV